MPKYSICITNYNTIGTIRKSLESILSKLDTSSEVVVCDNYSNDGSREILEEYAREGKIKLIIERSSRGRGRQIAFENSTGDYIISGVDTDDVLTPVFKDFLKVYHEQHEGYVLSADTIHIIPRKVVEEIGGWKDLQYYEDVDFCRRVESIGKWHGSQFVLVERGKAKRGPFHRIKEIYDACQCRYKIGDKVFDELEMTSLYNKPLVFFVCGFALITCKLKNALMVHARENRI